jgi:hypothetical protein
MKPLNLKTVIKVGKRKVRLDDMDYETADKLVCLLKLHKDRIYNMFQMGTARKALYDLMAKKNSMAKK